MKVGRRNPLSGNVNVMDLDVTMEQIERWKNGELVQNVMPHLTADEREFLISGILPNEWDELFGEEL